MRPVMFSSALMSRSRHQRLVGEERRQVLEQDLVLRVLRRLAVDLVDLDQREVALAVLRRADLALDRVAGVQVEAADLRRRDVDVVGAGEVARVGRAQEAEAVGQDLEHAVAEDALALLRLLLQHREDEVVLAHPVGALDLAGVGDVDQLGDVFGLEFGEMHGGRAERAGGGRSGVRSPRRGLRGSWAREGAREAPQFSGRRPWILPRGRPGRPGGVATRKSG